MINSRNVLENQKKLWETSKSLDMLKKTLVLNFNAVESNNALTLNKKTIASIFKYFF